MITEDFCSFEVAKLLKKKGFDELCIFKYNSEGVRMKAGVAIDEWQNSELDDDECSCVSLQMAMKWLRGKHNIFIQISAVLQDQPFGLYYRPSIQDYHAYARYDNFNEYVTYEEAVEAAIKYSLKNLI